MGRYIQGVDGKMRGTRPDGAALVAPTPQRDAGPTGPPDSASDFGTTSESRLGGGKGAGNMYTSLGGARQRKRPPDMVVGSPAYAVFAAQYLNTTIPASEGKARRIAEAAHAGQTDQNGDPYIGHPAAVADLTVERPEYGALTVEDQQVARQAAWLHDTLEDTAVTSQALQDAGFSDDVIATVEAVTSHKGEPKRDYYARVVAAGPVAVAVKLGDLAHNNLPERRETLPGSPSHPVVDGEEDRYTRLGRKYWLAYTSLGVEVPEHLRQFAPE